MKAGPVPPSGVICFMGMDGAGKSTVIEGVDQWLRENGIAARVLHTHDYNVKALHSLNSLGKESWVRRFPFLFFPWPFVALFDHLMTFRKRFGGGGLILTDRYFYDKYVRFRFWGIALPGLFYLYKWLIPKPLCAILLDVPTSVALERKGEYSREDYDRFRREYLDFAKKMDRLSVVDATMPLPGVLDAVKRCISSRMKNEEK